MPNPAVLKLHCRQDSVILQTVGIDCCDVRVRCADCTQPSGCVLTRLGMATEIISQGKAKTSEEALSVLATFYQSAHRGPVTYISGLEFTIDEVDREPKALIPVDLFIHDQLGPLN